MYVYGWSFISWTILACKWSFRCSRYRKPGDDFPKALETISRLVYWPATVRFSSFVLGSVDVERHKQDDISIESGPLRLDSIPCLEHIQMLCSKGVRVLGRHYRETRIWNGRKEMNCIRKEDVRKGRRKAVEYIENMLSKWRSSDTSIGMSSDRGESERKRGYFIKLPEIMQTG